MNDAALGLWRDTLPGPVIPRPALDGDTEADVAIVGAGFTGLWTAYYLTRADPSLRVVVLEREVAGFGASGRNGGWCSALFPAGPAALARRYGEQPARALGAAMRATVAEIGRVLVAEGIDAHWAHGGTITAARTPLQLARAREEVATAHRFGATEEDLRLLDATETASRLGATSVLGGTYTPHCGAVHPGRLVRGLADLVERYGGTVYEQTPVTRITPGRAVTSSGTVRARYIVRATEGFTAQLRGQRRTMAPVYSLMIATEPLPEAFWAVAGLTARETFTDGRHLIIYGQRTADGRIAFGGRGAPYHFGSRVRPAYDHEPAVFGALREVLVELFPDLADVRITHTWGGPLGITRDWQPSVGLDPQTGLAWAGGYVGDGVGTSNLAGRTLADLIAGQDSDLVALPWVGHRSPRWEPEPLRWLGINTGLRLMTAADRTEARTGRPSRLATAFGRFLGG